MNKSIKYLSVFLCLLFVLIVVSACSSSESNVGENSQNTDSREKVSTNENNSGDSNEGLPTTVTFGTHATGSSHHAVGSGIAKLLSDKTKMNAIVQPYAGPNAWMPEMEEGTLNFGILTSFDAGWAYTGGPGYDKPYKNIRLMLNGNRAYNAGFAVRQDSGIESIRDLKGKKVASDYGGNIALQEIATLVLRSVGLTWDDVQAVPVPDYSTGTSILRDGMVDAAMAGGPDAAQLLEAHSATKMKALPFADLKPQDIENGIPSEIQSMIDETLPGLTLAVAPAGLGILEEDIVIPLQTMVIAASEKTSQDTVYVALKTIWENLDELKPVHRWLSDFSTDQFLDLNATVPYHEGAIKFYKEQGLWTEEHDKMQELLLNK